MKNLIIVESPTKAKTLSRFLGQEYQLMSTMGHLRDLPQKKLGVDVEHDFQPTYLLISGKRKIVAQLRKAAAAVQKVYLATDPDREGEAIAWHVSQLLASKKRGGKKKGKTPPLARIVFHEITQSAIKKALANPGTINLQLVDAQQARRILDRLVGYKLSPLLWRKIRRGLSAGRVQSVAVRLVVDREREIEKFIPQEYWEIWAELKRHLGGRRPNTPTLLAKLMKKNGQKIKIEEETAATEIRAELEKAAYEVAEVKRKTISQNPAPPFTTSTLQQQAAQRLRFSSKRTMRVAQSLYEKGLITYHRTDSVVLAKEAIEMIRRYIEKTDGGEYLPEKPRVYRTKSKVAQEAHEAIRPTDIKISELKQASRDEQRLYNLIWRRAVASQMAAAVWDQTRVWVQAAGEKNIYLFLAEGKVIKFDGWLKLFRVPSGEELPALKRGEELDLIKIKSEQKFTQPPARYTEATLIKALEERGIGRPSTYAPTISTIQERQYVEKLEGRFHPTALGVTVNDFLLEYFPQIMDYEFTARMEDELDEIANGKREWVPVVRAFYQPFEKRLEGVATAAKRVKVPTEATDERCPKCKKGLLVIRVGRFGKFLSCSRFPKCDYTAPYTPKLEGVKCPQCGGEVVIRKTKKGKQFYGCINWPDCNWASWRKPK